MLHIHPRWMVTFQVRPLGVILERRKGREMTRLYRLVSLAVTSSSPGNLGVIHLWLDTLLLVSIVSKATWTKSTFSPPPLFSFFLSWVHPNQRDCRIRVLVASNYISNLQLRLHFPFWIARIFDLRRLKLTLIRSNNCAALWSRSADRPARVHQVHCVQSPPDTLFSSVKRPHAASVVTNDKFICNFYFWR